jgi:hypothetical protein
MDFDVSVMVGNPLTIEGISLQPATIAIAIDCFTAGRGNSLHRIVGFMPFVSMLHCISWWWYSSLGPSWQLMLVYNHNEATRFPKKLVELGVMRGIPCLFGGGHDKADDEMAVNSKRGYAP